MCDRRARRLSKFNDKTPVLEHVLTDTHNSFLWRRDDYPCGLNGWNIHPEYEIHLITNASGVALVGDYIGRFEPGHLSIVAGGLPHDWVTELTPGDVVPGRDVVLQFDADRVSCATSTLPELNEFKPLLSLAQRGLEFHGETRQIGARIMQEIGPARGIERLMLFLRLLQVLAKSLAKSTEHSFLSSGQFDPPQDPAVFELIQPILAHLLANFATDLRISEVAELARMNASTFSRFFKRNTGKTFTDHLTRLRIGRACDLLANSGLPVTDICYEVGYANIANFNRTFRNHRGQTPSAYRRLAKHRAR